MKQLDVWLRRHHAVRDSAWLGCVLALLILLLMALGFWLWHQHNQRTLQMHRHELVKLQRKTVILQQQQHSQHQRVIALQTHHWLQPNWHVVLQLAEQDGLQVIHFTQVEAVKKMQRMVVSVVVQGGYTALLQWIQNLAMNTAGLYLLQWRMQPTESDADQVRLAVTLAWSLAQQSHPPVLQAVKPLQPLADPFQHRAVNHQLTAKHPWQLVGTMQLDDQALALFTVGDELISRTVGDQAGQHGQYQVRQISDQGITLQQQGKEAICIWRIGGVPACDITSP